MPTRRLDSDLAGWQLISKANFFTNLATLNACIKILQLETLGWLILTLFGWMVVGSKFLLYFRSLAFKQIDKRKPKTPAEDEEKEELLQEADGFKIH